DLSPAPLGKQGEPPSCDGRRRRWLAAESDCSRTPPITAGSRMADGRRPRCLILHRYMGDLLGDLRYACRSLVRQPTFAAVAILTLVLGIGLNTAIFSVIKAVLLNQLPYQDPSRLVVLSEQSPEGRPDLVAPLTYQDWKQQAHTMSDMAAFRQLRYAF